MSADPEVGSRKWKCIVEVRDGKPHEINNAPLSWKTDSGNRPTDEWLLENGFCEFVDTNAPIYDIATQDISKDDIKSLSIVNGKVVQTWTIRALTESEKKEAADKQWEVFRKLRNEQLIACDWTQLPDSNVNKAAWAVYRQKLRDLPANTTNPYVPVWPQKPT